MEGILLTAGLIVLIVAALALMVRTWPCSSTRTGYRVWKSDAEGDRGVTTPEDERPWHFDDHGGGAPKA